MSREQFLLIIERKVKWEISAALAGGMRKTPAGTATRSPARVQAKRHGASYYHARRMHHYAQTLYRHHDAYASRDTCRHGFD